MSTPQIEKSASSAAVVGEELEAPEQRWQSFGAWYYHGISVGNWLHRYGNRYEFDRLAALRGIELGPDCDTIRTHLESGKITIADLLDTRLCGGPTLPSGFSTVDMDGEALDGIQETWLEYDKSALAAVEREEREYAEGPGYGRNLAIARKRRDETAQRCWSKICPVFHVAARTVDRSSGESTGYLLRFEVDGQQRQFVLLDELLESGTAFRKLADVGFIVENNTRARRGFIRIVREAETCARVHIEPQPGWYGDTFLAPTGEAITGPDTDDGTDAERLARGPIGHALHPDVACDPSKGGSLDAWREKVVAQCWAQPTQQFQLGPILGLAGVILGITKGENFTTHLEGLTSGGKTTSEAIAASGVANPDFGKGTMIDAGAAAPDVEKAALRGNGTSYQLDGKEAKNATRLVATVRNHSAGRGGSVLVMSSEAGLLKLAADAGESIDPGVLVRVLPIATDRITRIDPAAAEAIKRAAFTHYGWALPELVRHILAEGLHKGDDLLAAVQDRAKLFLQGETDAELYRAAQHVGCLQVTAELMQDSKLLPGTVEDIDALMNWLWDGYLAFRRQWTMQGSTAARKVRERLEAFAASSKVFAIDDAPAGLGGAQGWHDGSTLYIRADVLPGLLGPILGARKAIRTSLGPMLILPSGGRHTLTWEVVPGRRRVRHYRIAI